MAAVLEKLTQTPDRRESDGDTTGRRNIMRRLAGKVLGSPFAGRERSRHSFDPANKEGQTHVSDLLAKHASQGGDNIGRYRKILLRRRLNPSQIGLKHEMNYHPLRFSQALSWKSFMAVIFM